jgi:precorrin isomerase
VLGDADKRGRLLQQKIYLEKIPIRSIDFSNPAEKSHHDRMVKLVDSMLALHKQLSETKSAAQKEIIQRQIHATDAEIDRLVYELYGLTDDEIKIVEEGTK